MFEFLVRTVESLLQNETVLALLVLGASGGLIYSLREVFNEIGNWFLTRITYTIDVQPHDNFRRLVPSWIQGLDFLSLKKITFKLPWQVDLRALNSDNLKYTLSNASGFVLPKNGRPLMYITTTTESEAAAVHTRYSIRIFTFKKSVVDLVSNDIIAANIDNSAPVIYLWRDSYWEKLSSLDVDFFKNQYISDAAQKLIDEAITFKASEQAYIDARIKYRKGTVLSGVPGSGKSTLPGIVSAFTGMDIYIVNSLDKVAIALAEVPVHSLILIDDIDLMLTGKRAGIGASSSDDDKKEEKEDDMSMAIGLLSKMLIAELLTALDSLISFRGGIVYASTNDVDSLDDALLRPGRFDDVVKIDRLSHDEQERYLQYFYKKPCSLSAEVGRHTLAELAGICTKHMGDPDSAVKEINNVKTY